MAERAGRQLSLAEAYRHFGQTDAKGSSPLYEAVATAIAESPEALATIEQAPVLKRHPTVILASLHDLTLQGRAPQLAAAYAAQDSAAAAGAAVEALRILAHEIVALAAARQTQTNETGRCAILHPAIATVAARAGASRIGLIDIGCSAGLNLNLDRYSVHYSDGTVRGAPHSALTLRCETRGQCTPPDETLPPVVARIGIDLEPVDVTVPADARWLHACLWPDQPERLARLDAAIEISRADPPQLLRGNALDLLPEAVTLVSHDALVVVTTTWALAYFSLEDRLRFLRRLDEQAARRPIAWVSAEGVGIAPGIPTVGDSRLAGHSHVGVTLLDGRVSLAETVARCHPHGAWMEWLG